MHRLRGMVLEVFDRFIGLEVRVMAVDCCITEAPWSDILRLDDPGLL
jgi:hypothetical protein